MIIEERIEVAAPPERAWAVMSDVERWPEWTSTVTSVERLDDGAFGVGSRARIRQPKLPTAVWTVTALEPGRYFEWRNSSPGLTSVGGHRVTPAAGGATRVTLTLTWSGWLTPIIGFFYGKLSRRYVRTEAEGLKRRSESGR
jgi:uncharacterized membrane protein